MNLTDMKANLKIELADADWDDDELSRAVTKATADLSRFLPDEKIEEVTFTPNVTDENITPLVHGTYLTLNNKPIKYGSETVKNIAQWVHPTGYNDPDAAWTTPEYAYDGSILVTSAAMCAVPINDWGSYLEFTIAEMEANAIIIYVSGVEIDEVCKVDQISIDIYHTSAWHNIYEGVFSGCYTAEGVCSGCVWLTKTFTAVDITKVRVKFHSTSTDTLYFANIHEIYFRGTGDAPTYTRDTDYTMDYMNGKITTIDGGNMYLGTYYRIDYSKDTGIVDISSLTNLIRVLRVEYPLKTAAVMELIPFSIWGDLLFIAPEQMVENKHIILYYQCSHTAPTSDTDGSFPSFLDELVLTGASAYALMTRAVELENDAKTSLESAGTILVAISNTDIKTVLDKVPTQITAMETSLGELADLWTDEVTFRAAADDYLTSGDDYINKVNVGASVAEIYGNYAQIQMTLASLSESRRTGKLTEASAYLSSASAFINEANARMNLNDAEIRQAETYLNESINQTTLAKQYMDEGIQYRNEFWTVLRDKAQYRNELSLVAQRQPA